MKTLSIVVPCFNEEAVIEDTVIALKGVLERLKRKGKVASDSFILFVDDGSMDGTWVLIERLSGEYDDVCGIRLSSNRGHQTALIAGLETADADLYLTIDADLQDDVNVIEVMVDSAHSGADIVYGVRVSREVDSRFKRVSAELYYKLLRWMGVAIVFNHADYRLMSRRARNALLEYVESNLFIRGIVPTLGFRTAKVEYERKERQAGETKYPLFKMLALAIDGVTSFTAFPLRVIAGLGLLIFVISLLLSGWVLVVKFFTSNAVPGWASSVLPMYLLGGVQLLSLGVVGEYIAKIYIETKRRPRYFLDGRCGKRVSGAIEGGQELDV